MLWAFFVVAIVALSAVVVMVMMKIIALRKEGGVISSDLTVYDVAQKQVDRVAFHLMETLGRLVKYLYAQVVIGLHNFLSFLREKIIQWERQLAGWSHSVRNHDKNVKNPPPSSQFLQEIGEHQKKIQEQERIAPKG